MHDSKRLLGRLVAQELLCHDCTRPAAKHPQENECPFAGVPFTRTGSTFIVPIESGTYDAHSEVSSPQQ